MWAGRTRCEGWWPLATKTNTSLAQKGEGALRGEAVLPKDLAFLPEVQAASRHYRYDAKAKNVQEMRASGMVVVSDEEEVEVEEAPRNNVKEPTSRLPPARKPKEVRTEPQLERQTAPKVMRATQPIAPFQTSSPALKETSTVLAQGPKPGNGLASVCGVISQAKTDAATGGKSR